MSDEIPDMFAIRPDRKGPKTIAILLMLGALFFGVLAYTDISNANSEELSQAQIETLINVPNQQGENLSIEQYQDFHKEINESDGYLIRGTALGMSSIFVFIGSIFLFTMKPIGGKIAIGGAGISFVGGIYGCMIIYDAAKEHLLESMLVQTHEITGYLCGVCSFLCGAMALLPLINTRAKLAFIEANSVKLVQDECE
tara:strand:+ start:560 stop:1153 length:594 start_codon:yes stop_codon:yes gene_type:complete